MIENAAVIVVAAVYFLLGSGFTASLRFHLELGGGSLFHFLGTGGLSAGSFARFHAMFDRVCPSRKGCVRVRWTGRRLHDQSCNDRAVLPSSVE